MVKKPTKQAVPNILPREPLTKKARAAIECYALHKCGDMRIYSFLIDHTLKAERMRRSDLYEFLEGHGYRWNKYSWKGGKRMTSEQEDQRRRRQPQQRQCDECGKLAVLIPIYDQYNTDVRQRLCKVCEEARARRLEAFYEGD